MLTPFKFNPGDIVCLDAPLLNAEKRLMVQAGEKGEIMYLIYDKNGTSASVKFANYRGQVRETQLVPA